MELSNNGRLILLLGATLLIVGFLFSNTLVLLPAALALLYLISDGISFHRAVRVFKDSISLEDHPSRIEIPVGHWFKVETTLKNPSSQDFRIIRLTHDLWAEFDEQGHAPEWVSFPSHGKLRIENLLKTKISGRFEITASIVVFETQRRLFRQSVRFPSDVTILAQPLAAKTGPSVDASVLYDLAADTLRRGPGTDLAGIRPSNPMDEYHRIDWKATARTGKLMTRESYLERDPSIMLMIDLCSSIRNSSSSLSTRNVFLSELAKLLAIIRSPTPIGLILYDERKAIANVEPSVGVENRERILRTLLEETSLPPIETPPAHQATHSYDDLTRETHALTALSSDTKSYRERFNSFSRAILPFYEHLESTYLEKLRKQGVSAAFDIVCNLSQPVLVIAISDGNANSRRLIEGAKKAAKSNHRVIVALLKHIGEPIKTAPLATQEFGLRVLECAAEELSQTVYLEVLEMSRIRSIVAAR